MGRSSQFVHILSPKLHESSLIRLVIGRASQMLQGVLNFGYFRCNVTPPSNETQVKHIDFLKIDFFFVTAQVLTATSMKIRDFCNVASYSLVAVDRRFGGAYCLHNRAIITLMMEAVRTSETSVYSETTRRYIPEGSNLRFLLF
jgi:hypothetical protein